MELVTPRAGIAKYRNKFRDAVEVAGDGGHGGRSGMLGCVMGVCGPVRWSLSGGCPKLSLMGANSALLL